MPNISKTKSNQTMKFGQLIDYNMSIIITEKWYTQCDGETPYSEKLKLSTVCFYCMPSWKLLKYIENNSY